MKRITILFVVFLMIFCFVGCSKADITYQNSDNTESSAINNAENAVAPQKDNTENRFEDDNILFSVLYNQKPFITAKGTTVYLKDYKPVYKESEEVDYYEKDNVFIPLDYTFVDLDKDGNNELIVTESPYADNYLILRKENEKIYGYYLYVRWFSSLKEDGSFWSSGGAFSIEYNTINFDENKYNISTLATFDFVGDEEKPSSNKYGFEPDYEKSVFEIGGKRVSFEEIKQFADEWEKRPEAEWIKFEQTN